MKLFRRPLTLLFVLCMIAVCISVVGAMLCHKENDKCLEKFDAPIAVVCCLGCLVVSFALFFVEMSGHSTGIQQYTPGMQ